MFGSPAMKLLATTVSILFRRSASFSISPARAYYPRSLHRKETLSMTISTTSEKDEALVQNMLYRVRQCNYMPQNARKSMVEFVVEGSSVGKCTTKVANLLCKSSPSEEPVFQLQYIDGKKQLTLTEHAGLSQETRTNAVKKVMEKLRSEGVITGWRDELYPLSSSFYSEPLLLVERAAAPFLGMKQYGVHINGVVENENGHNEMWMARRSKSKSKYPSMVDQIVAGGQPHGIGLAQNVIKECMEEAGIPEDVVVKGLQAAGVVSYEDFEEHPSDLVDGVFQTVVLFNYDLYLPKDFNPTPIDGEVDYFFKWTISDILESMHPAYHDPIKPNCYLCIIDYLLRKGLGVSMETKGYLDVFRELRSGDCT
jgi:isopentenyldiphosphate isomerase